VPQIVIIDKFDKAIAKNKMVQFFCLTQQFLTKVQLHDNH